MTIEIREEGDADRIDSKTLPRFSHSGRDPAVGT